MQNHELDCELTKKSEEIKCFSEMNVTLKQELVTSCRTKNNYLSRSKFIFGTFL